MTPLPRSTGSSWASTAPTVPFAVLLDLLRFARANRRFLGFGFGMAFVSSFGQTFYIALFGGEIRSTFALSHGEFGSIYSGANLLSAGALIWLGRLIDHVDLRVYAVSVCAGLAIACAGLALAPGIVALLVAIFGLRLFGQGLCLHTATVSMARYFDVSRGRALSVAAMGLPTGETLLPSIAVALTVAVGWRNTWAGAGAAIVVIAVPLLLWLLRGHRERHRAMLARLARPTESVRWPTVQWTRGEVLHDRVFHLLLPTLLAINYILTGLFFHQAHVADSKGWTLEWIAICFVGYAVASIATALTAGGLADRSGAVRVLPYLLVPLAIGLTALMVSDHPLAGLLYMTASGTSVGGYMVIVSALWAELYGVAHLGAIKSAVAGFSIFFSALAPAMMGWLFDAGMSVERVTLGCLAWVVLAEVLIFRAVRLVARRAPAS